MSSIGELHRKIKRKEKLITKYESDIRKMWNKIQKICTHKRTRISKSYYAGCSYYHEPEEFITDIVCVDCNLILNTKKRVGDIPDV